MNLKEELNRLRKENRENQEFPEIKEEFIITEDSVEVAPQSEEPVNELKEEYRHDIIDLGTDEKSSVDMTISGPDLSGDPEFVPAPKRKRRTKAEMEAAKKEFETAKEMSPGEFVGEHGTVFTAIEEVAFEDLPDDAVFAGECETQTIDHSEEE